ncbi:hypothetical protein [Acetobacter senegalensis]|uniref:hypothetical protein n=1 Tax=Acetobacter senegalensis TaxID=446692 RepID=UPI002656078F|nr:hypothetical protein [Acetobacter senegalensis]MDN7351039.1 hypothetical protein [Acetobacter senegalensis]
MGTLTIGTPSTLSRTTIIGTTSGGASALNFSGSVEVYNEIPAEYVPILEADGHLLVKSITDWTSKQAVPASDADGRYMQNYVGGSDQRIIRMAYRPSMGAPFIDGFVGGPFFFQRQGDYATNAAVNAEVTARVNAVSGLDTAKVNRGGDTMTGGLVTQSPKAAATGQYNYSPNFTAKNIDGAEANFFAQELVGTQSALVLRLRYAGADRGYWWLNEDGSITQSSKGNVAFVSQIPTDYMTNSTFQNSLPFVDKNLRAQVFTKVVGNGVWVTIPQAFKTLAGVLALQFSSGSEGIRPLRVETNGATGGQFQMSEWSEGGNTQYTFLVFGYF